MEYCELTLADYIGGERKIVENAIALSFEGYRELSTLTLMWHVTGSILVDICKGLLFIHDCNEVHRDLKPSNGFDSYGGFS